MCLLPGAHHKSPARGGRVPGHQGAGLLADGSGVELPGPPDCLKRCVDSTRNSKLIRRNKNSPLVFGSSGALAQLLVVVRDRGASAAEYSKTSSRTRMNNVSRTDTAATGPCNLVSKKNNPASVRKPAGSENQVMQPN